MAEGKAQEIFAPGTLETFARRVLEAAGGDAAESAVVAENLVAANLRGIDSHGVIRLPLYVSRLEAGLVAPRTKLEIVREAPAACVLDAGNGWGAVAGRAAMGEAIKRARRAGVGVAAVRNSNHFGIAAFYAQAAAAENMIGIALTNASPAMAPWGGKAPYFGTNPICVAVPAGRERPVIYDGATSVAAIGKIVLAAKKGETIPPTWATDPEGRPTTDPDVAASGTLLPMGEYKGYGLALMVDVLAGILAGAAFGPYVSNLRRLDAPQNVGHFFAALNISAFLDLDEFLAGMEHLAQDIRNALRAAGSDRIYLPGEIEWEWERKRKAEGIPVPEGVLKELRELGKRYSVSLGPE